MADSEYRYGVPLLEFAARFKEERFVLAKWGARGAILIDRQTPLLSRRQSRCDLVRLLCDYVGPDLVVRMSDVPESSRPGFVEALEEFFPRHSRTDGFEMKQAAVGIDITVNVTVYGDDPGQYRNIQLPMPRALTRPRDNALDAYPMPQKGRELSNEEKMRHARETEAIRSNLERVNFRAFGTANNHLAEGLRETATILEKLNAELDTQTKKAAEDLLSKVGLKLSLKDLPQGKVPLDNLSEDMRRQVWEQMSGAWKHWGYESLADAEQFLVNSSAVEVTMNIGLSRTFTPHDKQTGRPSTGMVYNFILIRP